MNAAKVDAHSGALILPKTAVDRKLRALTQENQELRSRIERLEALMGLASPPSS